MAVILQDRYTWLQGNTIGARMPWECYEMDALNDNPRHHNLPKPKHQYGDNNRHGVYQVVSCPENLFPAGNRFEDVLSLEQSIRRGYLLDGMILKRWKRINDPQNSEQVVISGKTLIDLSGNPVPFLVLQPNM